MSPAQAKSSIWETFDGKQIAIFHQAFTDKKKWIFISM